MIKKKDSKESKFDDNIKALVIARIEAQMPSNLRLCIGNAEGSMSGTQIIDHINNDDEIGEQIIQSHLNFMQAQASGQLTSALNSVA